MNYKIVITLTALMAVLLIFAAGCGSSKEKVEKVQFKAEDGVTVTGDLYFAHPASAPFILLCHQAGYSRGEYLEIAPKLNELGFNCMAIDQRAGSIINEVTNETRESASKLGASNGFTDALKDVEAAVKYLREELKVESSLVWGSSYSASLAFIAADRNPDFIKGILSFSPGEYFTYEGRKIEEYAANIKIPVFITSQKYEESTWKSIYEKIPEGKGVRFLPENSVGIHGSSSLWKESDGEDEYWKAVGKFLDNFITK